MLQSPGRKFSWLIALVFLTACVAGPPTAPATDAQAVAVAPTWQLSDVRLLDGLDSASPAAELVALYTRFFQEEAHIRLDFLDLSPVANFDILLALDTQAGGASFVPEGWPSLAEPLEKAPAWDYLVDIQAEGAIHVFSYSTSSGWALHPASSVRVLRNPLQGMVEIHLKAPPRPAFSPKSRVQVWSLFPGDGSILDTSGVVKWNSLPPKSLALVLAFSGVFPAYTPSQGLRKWDGAHTGPSGGRHGLSNLLRAARAQEVPLLLLDAADPASLAALDYQGGLALVKAMARQGLLSLASPLPPGSSELPASVISQFLEKNASALQSYDLPGMDWIYAPILSEESYAQSAVSTALPSSISPSGRSILSLPAFYNPSADYQPTSEGLPLALRQLLITQALASQSSSNSFLLIGGSLPQSSWGNPQAARAALRYLMMHPWLRIAHPRELLLNSTLKLLPGNAPILSSPAGLQPPDLITQLTAAPVSTLSQAAWSSYRAAFAPLFPYPTRLLELRQSYLAESFRLLSAAQWARNPQPLQDCSQDIDQDGQVECLFSNLSVLLILQPANALLEGVFALAQDGAHQLSGSSAQLISGLSDPLDWIETNSQLFDPQVVDGYLSTNGEIFNAFFSEEKLFLQDANEITFASFKLLPDGVHVQFFKESPGDQISIPLLLDPWLRFNPSGLRDYSGETFPTGFHWSAGNSSALVFETNAPFSSQVFTSSRANLAATEDPNFAYPPGHSLPYPLAVIHLQAASPYAFSLRLVRP